MTQKYSARPFLDDYELATLYQKLTDTRTSWVAAVDSYMDGPDYVTSRRVMADQIAATCQELERQIVYARAEGLKGLAIQGRLLQRFLYGSVDPKSDVFQTLVETITFRLEELSERGRR